MNNEAERLAVELTEDIEGFPEPTQLEKRAAALLRSQSADIAQLQHLYRVNESEWQDRYDAEIERLTDINRDAMSNLNELADMKNAEIEALRVDAARREGLQDVVSKALRKAWQLGQTYWAQADSDSWSQNKKSNETQATFGALVEETRAAIKEELK